MFRHNRPRGRRGIVGSIALTLALSVSALAATGTGAAVRSQGGGKVDKSAVLKYAIPLAEQGGVRFDPSNQVNNPNDASWMNLIYDTMIRPTEDGEGEPGLATKWATPDPQTVELTLRQGVKFTDGASFNAAAVKAAWDRHLASNTSTTPTDVKAVTAIEAVGDNVVRVRLSQPVAANWINEHLKTSRWLAVPSPAAAAAGTLNSKPVGAGPYQLDSYLQDQKITLSKNPQYYDKKSQRLASIEMLQAPYGPPQLTALQSGTANLTWNVPTQQIPTIENQSGMAITTKPGVRVFDLALCTSKGPFASKEARQALQYALDRDAINDAAIEGLGTPTIVPLTEASPFYNKSLEKTYKFNVKKAKTLLQQAGVAPGTTVQALVPTSGEQPVIAEVVKAQLEDVGLNMQITPSTNASADAARLQPDITFVGLDTNLLQFAINLTTTLNICGWRNAEASTAFATTRDGSKTEEDQQVAWDRLQEILLEEAPFVFTVVSPLVVAGSNKVKGIETVSSTYGPYLNSMYMTK
jgi:peptide/nickel transport system substrate-binding protein